MADLRLREILSEVVDLQSRMSYGVDLLSQHEGNVRRGDSFQVASFADFTVVDDGSTTGNTAQTVSETALTLTVDQQPAVFVKVPQMDDVQKLNGSGNWSRAVARNTLIALRNKADDNVLRDYVLKSLCYTTDASRHVNPEGANLSDGLEEISKAAAELTDQGGGDYSSLILMANPMAVAAMRHAKAFQDGGQANPDTGALGLTRMGSVHGIPVVQTQSLPRLRNVACTASAVTSNVATFTVGAGHGIVPGMRLSSTGFGGAGEIANISSSNPARVTAVAATSITATTSGIGDDADGGDGTLIVEAAESLLLDRRMHHYAMQLAPQIKIIDVPGTTNLELQATIFFGRVGRAGWARVIGSPARGVRL